MIFNTPLYYGNAGPVKTALFLYYDKIVLKNVSRITDKFNKFCESPQDISASVNNGMLQKPPKIFPRRYFQSFFICASLKKIISSAVLLNVRAYEAEMFGFAGGQEQNKLRTEKFDTIKKKQISRRGLFKRYCGNNILFLISASWRRG